MDYKQNPAGGRKPAGEEVVQEALWGLEVQASLSSGGSWVLSLPHVSLASFNPCGCSAACKFSLPSPREGEGRSPLAALPLAEST